MEVNFVLRQEQSGLFIIIIIIIIFVSLRRFRGEIVRKGSLSFDDILEEDSSWTRAESLRLIPALLHLIFFSFFCSSFCFLKRQW